jgi:hypothetical protein
VCTDDDELVGGDGRPRSSRVDFRVGRFDGRRRSYSAFREAVFPRWIMTFAVIIQRDTSTGIDYRALSSFIHLHTHNT